MNYVQYKKFQSFPLNLMFQTPKEQKRRMGKKFKNKKALFALF